ncbi:photosystem II repair protein Psb32 [Cylindrospermopsis raciborskii]|uniref:Beta-propeller domain-containing protein, methanol dehydrogenase n=1 Tax=Cylindrospermopsis raciborskii CENA302 TaxID=1170768 RepID=A0A9Q5QWN5_9CYAN|nr:TPM domain-containing protein [Cylindrospermopsis raciborskii]NLQ05703.1 YgcG family protein [Cylindrospermopsis raciborskii MVCC19]OHY36381.1 beta-propeller domain-containing protein, methanol dehydrogenase [Cylindrospermopsis raciborskii MVCC14]OPH09768.1 beta-propeller domain-containing protein, methanol dehydrogenase [Cylindrospermopsis raciborskii CENA302]
MKQLLKQLSSTPQYVTSLILSVLLMIVSVPMFATPASATGVYQIPDLTPNTWVVDEGDVISRFNEGQITSAFQDLAQKTGKEVRIVTIHRFDYGETPQSFAQGLFTKWFPTPETQANQSILVVDTLTNGATIVSGEQVKTLLTDEIATSVTEKTLGIELRSGNKYNQGLLNVRDRLVAVLSGEPDPGPPEEKETIQVEGTFATAAQTNKNKSNSTAWVVGLLIAATVIPMATYYLYQINQPSKEG